MGENNLDFKTWTQGTWTVMDVSGEVDLHSATLLEKRLSSALSNGGEGLLVRLADVGFMDSTGLGTLITVQNKAVEKGRRFALAEPSEQVKRLLELTGVSTRLETYESITEA